MKAKQVTFSLGLVAIWVHNVSADVYMHNPRGSNNRNCGTGENRRNGNRLFDSENNAKGGYACPRAKPFDCYKYYDDDAARAECNERNEDAGAAAIDRETGRLQAPDVIATPTMYYYTGSILPIEWTNQHGAGTNSKLHSDIVIQVACESTLTDDCGDVDSGETCGPRDGTPVNNQDEATTQIDTTVEDQLNYQRGRHETLRYYERCDNRERNKGLFAADQNINGNSAMYTRQNPNNNRQGLECKEEAHYYPYWHDSPWVDVAIITSSMERCLASAQQSQNVVGKNECVCDAEECEGRGNNPNNERACEEKGGDWVTYPAYSSYLKGVEAPECVEGVFSRVNHLGNVQGNGNPYTYNWTIPEYLAGNDSCVLRLRYNVSSGDGDSISVVGTSIHNGAQSPIKDRNNNEKLTYVGMEGLDIGDQAVLGLAVQTNQYGRTFQDRSYTFAVKPMPQGIECDNVYNLNVRGKRGNIVQSYPSVEYDFVPSVLVAELDDCVHLQWTGSDYNPARNPNNGEGGPPDPTNLGAGRSDRHNMVQMSLQSENRPVGDIENFTIFDTTDRPDLIKRLMFIDQPIDDPDQCLPFSEIQDLPGNQNDRERNHLNCGKLSGAKTPYFDAGLVKFSARGTFRYMSTRNNNFTNRSQKGVIIVEPTTKSPSTSPTSAPTTNTPTSAPTTNTPTNAPTTNTPTSAPTTNTPTSAPTTNIPTNAPTTNTPTSAPTTNTPTSAPTTKAPTSSATESPTHSRTVPTTQEPVDTLEGIVISISLELFTTVNRRRILYHGSSGGSGEVETNFVWQMNPRQLRQLAAFPISNLDAKRSFVEAMNKMDETDSPIDLADVRVILTEETLPGVFHITFEIDAENTAFVSKVESFVQTSDFLDTYLQEAKLKPGGTVLAYINDVVVLSQVKTEICNKPGLATCSELRFFGVFLSGIGFSTFLFLCCSSVARRKLRHKASHSHADVETTELVASQAQQLREYTSAQDLVTQLMHDLQRIRDVQKPSPMPVVTARVTPHQN